MNEPIRSDMLLVAESMPETIKRLEVAMAALSTRLAAHEGLLAALRFLTGLRGELQTEITAGLAAQEERLTRQLADHVERMHRLELSTATTLTETTQ